MSEQYKNIDNSNDSQSQVEQEPAMQQIVENYIPREEPMIYSNRQPIVGQISNQDNIIHNSDLEESRIENMPIVGNIRNNPNQMDIENAKENDASFHQDHLLDDDENNVNNASNDGNRRYEYRSPLPPNLNEIYYKYNEQYQTLKKPNNNEPYMRISVMKTNMDIGNQQIYLVTKDGMVGSLKNTCTNDIIIGRQQSTSIDNKVDVHPNDIILPASDRAISRIHCKIIYNKGFNVRRNIPVFFMQFLMVLHNRSNTIWTNLPKHLISHIWNFLQPERKFTLVDIGSVYGSYIRVKPQKPSIMEKGQVYLIGADTLFNVLEINSIIQNEKDNNNKQLQQQNEDNEEFLIYLAQEQQAGSKIHGLREEEKEFINQYINRNNYKFTNNDTQLYGRKLTRPYLKLEIQNAGNNLTPCHVFIEEKNTTDKEFKVGRSQECDIVINQNTISRKQSRIYYENNNWMLMDGDLSRESANGTWISLTDYREKKGNGSCRIESEPKEIEHGTEIKISDSILKIEIFNNEPKRKTVLV